MGLYKNVLHHQKNSFPKWFLETIGVYVSMLNSCEYCVLHHFQGLKRLIGNDEKASRMIAELSELQNAQSFDSKQKKLIEYAKQLTLSPSTIAERDIIELKSHGVDDGEILEINQVVSYFNYANRTVQGLGVNTDGDILGLSPSDNASEENWSHQ